MQPPCYSRMQKLMSSAPGTLPPLQRAVRRALTRCAAAALLLVVLTPKTVQAQAGKRELTLVAAPEFGAWSRWTDPQRIAALQTSVAYGLTDWWSLSASLAAGHTLPSLAASAKRPQTPVGYLVIGPTVALDALRVIPFLGVHIGAVLDARQLHPNSPASALLRTQTGFDVRRRSGWQVGFAAAWHLSVPTRGTPTAFTTFGVRFGTVIETDRLR